MMIKWILYGILFCILSGCSTLDSNGYLSRIRIDTSDLNPSQIIKLKFEIVEQVKSYGFERSLPSEIYREPPDHEKFIHPNHNVVFYNLYFSDDKQIEITIRDARRTYSRSEALREEVDSLLHLIKNKVGGKRVTIEQQSTLLI